MSFVFTGSTQVTFLWQNDNIGNSRGKGKPPFGIDAGATGPYSPDDLVISFNDSSLPAQLQNLTFNQIKELNIPNLRTNRTLTFIVSGKQSDGGGLLSGKQNVNIQLWQGEEGSLSTIDNSNIQSTNGSNYCDPPGFNPNNCPKWVYNLPSIDVSVSVVQVVPWNDGTGPNQGVDDFSMSAQMTVTLTLECSSEFGLNSQICFETCTFNQDNLKTCYPSYRDYCLVNTLNPADINIFTNQNCINFFEDYIGQLGTNATIDNDLENACSKKFPFPSIDAYDNANSNVQNICACHLPVEIYNNLQETLVAEFPGFQFVGEDKRCLFPTCASSNFLTQEIGKACKVPACINLASVTNNGTLKGGVNIKQTNDCQKIASQTAKIEEKVVSWIEKYWIWIVLDIAVLIVLIIIIIVISNAEGNKKKKKIKIPNLNSTDTLPSDTLPKDI